MSQVIKEPKIYDFYCCYLLRSQPKPKSFYIGSTPDPIRRIRQHNGDLSRGGAYKTKRAGFRPWLMSLFVYGFPNKVSALMFEHAWQHAYQTRHIAFEDRVSKKRGSGNGIHHKLANARLLIKSDFFQRMNLKLQIFDLELYEVWCLNKFKIDKDIEVHHDLDSQDEMSKLTNFITTLKATDLAIITEAKKVLLTQLHDTKVNCKECSNDVSVEEERVGICPYCSRISHLRCMIPIQEQDLIPMSVNCNGCHRVLYWNDVVKLSNNLNKWE